MMPETIDLEVLTGLSIEGSMNTAEDVILRQIQHSIRLGYPQVQVQAPQPARVCLIGGGPSLDDTLDELRALYFAGAKIVTVNGSYQWCLQHNLKPSAHIMLDARAENARFVDPPVTGCHYLLASQCHPETWAAVEGRPDVWIWHAVAANNTHAKPVLDAFYRNAWQPSAGGTTVIIRAITLLRMLGYLRFDLFGVDSCVRGDQHHAYAQPENDADKVVPFDCYPTGRPDMSRRFMCTGWHAKQLECFLQMIRIAGHAFKLRVHGDGLLAYALQCSAEMQMHVGSEPALVAPLTTE